MHLNYPGASILQSVLVLFLTSWVPQGGSGCLDPGRDSPSWVPQRLKSLMSLSDILVYQYGRKYSISKSYLPKQVTHLSQETTEWQAEGVDIGRSFTGVIIAIHLPQSQSLLYGSWGVHSLQGWEKPSHLGRLGQLCHGGDFLSQTFFFNGIAKMNLIIYWNLSSTGFLLARENQKLFYEYMY